MTRTCKPDAPMAAVLRSAASLASDVEGFRRALETTVGERYRIAVLDDGSEVRLRRRT
jgi:ferric-dicitrate binding protein FerR (iron transport regulator)